MTPTTFSRVILVLSALYVTAHAQSCDTELEARTRGDVILGGFFNIHTTSRDGRQCGAHVDLHAIQRLEAALFAMDLINTVSFIPGVMFGMIAYDTCGLRHVATNKALRWLAEKNYISARETCQITPIHLGVIGPMYTGPAQDIASLLTSAAMTQISYNAGGSSVDDRRAYPYLLRTGPNGKVASKVILDILEEYGWSDIVVVTGHGVDEQDRKRDLYQMAGSNGKCVMLEITVDPEISHFDRIVGQLEAAVQKGVTGVVVLTLPKPTEVFFTKVQGSLLAHEALGRLQWVMGLPFTDSVTYHSLKDTIKGMILFNIHPQPVRGFQEYFTSLLPTANRRNPWFRTAWEHTFNCTVNGSCDAGHVATYRSTYRQAAGVARTVAAVYAYAQGFKDAHRDVCGEKYTGVCPDLASISTDRLITYLYKSTFVNLDGQIVSFDKNGDLAAPTFSIYNVQLDGVSYSLRKIGTWTEAQGLRLTTRIKVYDGRGRSSQLYPASRCRHRCLCRNQLDDDRYGIMAGGELVLQGVFDVHAGNALRQADPGGDHPLVSECGGRPAGGALQALEALYYALDLVNEDPDVLPGLPLGAATFDSCRSPQRALRHTENLLSGRVQLPNFGREGVRPIATIGGATSDVSTAMARLLAPLQVPQISYSASATPLDDKHAYPYFLRTVGAGSNQVRVVIDILRAFNWTYVKIVYSNNADGNSAMADFLDLVEETDICVATQVRLDDYLTHDQPAMRNIVQYYFLEAYVQARVVVMFVTDKHAQKVLQSLRSLVGPHGSHDLIWLVTDQWGTRESVTKGYEDLVNGAITLDFSTQLIPDFLTYFQSKKPWTNDRNPWFAEYWQHYFGCYLTGDFARLYNTSCSPAHTLENEHLAMASRVPLVVDAVYATALGLHNLITDHCGVNHTGLCRHARNNLHQLHSYVSQMHFYNGITKTAVSFDKLGSAPPKYVINNYRQVAQGVYQYVKVGSWQRGGLSLRTKDVMAASPFNVTVRASSIRSECTPTENQPCICSSRAVTDLKYDLRYDRLTLLGYFPVHGPGADGTPCSALRSRQGFEALMAFKYAVERVNMDPQLLGNVTLGYMVFDTCSDPDTAAVAFNAFDRSLRFFSQEPQLPVITYVHAFVGGVDDRVSRRLHQASMRGQHLVQISPGASSESLADREEYSRFLRTVAPDTELARAVVGLVKALQWSYVGLVYEDAPSARPGLPDLLERHMYDNGLCIASKLRLGAADDRAAYDDTVQELRRAKGAVGVVVVAGPGRTRALLAAVRRAQAVGRWVLLGTDLWGPDDAVFAGYDDVSRGALTVLPATSGDVYFDLYMRRLTLEQARANPWVGEFWTHHFRCDLQYGGRYGRACTGLETLENATFSSNPYAINTINAVYSYAYGISRLFSERCGGVVIPPCDLLLGGQRTSALVYDYIRNVRFTGADGSPFSFTHSGDGPARYKVLNYQMERLVTETKGYEQIGTWESGTLQLNLSLVQMYNADGEVVTVKSECPGTCNCSRTAVLQGGSGGSLGFTAHRRVWGVLVITFTLVGVVFSIVIIIFFILQFRHPVVEGASCSSSVLLLLTLLLLYLLNFAFMFSETAVICGIRRFAFGLLYVTKVNVLLVRAVRLYRLRSGSGGEAHPDPPPQPVTPLSGPAQCLLVLVLSGIQLVLGAQWLIIDPPRTESYLRDVSAAGHYPVYVERWRCAHTPQGLVASASYVFLLLVIALGVALRTVRVRLFQHESLYLLTSVSVTGVGLFTWALVYTLGGEDYGNPATCVTITLCASATLSLVFGRKMLALTASPDRRPSYPDPYDEQYAVPRHRDKTSSIVSRRHRSQKQIPVEVVAGAWRSSPGRGIENELSEHSVYSPHAGRQMASF